MAVTSWLVDRSAYVRMQAGQAQNMTEWNSRIERGLLHLPKFALPETAEER